MQVLTQCLKASADICEIDGEATQVEAALDWLRQEGITVDLLGDVLES